EPRVAQDQLDSAALQPADARPFAVLPQFLEMIFEIAQMAIRAQRAPAVAIVQGVEMLVARERPRLVVQALQEPVEELAHASRLARVRGRGSAKILHPRRNAPRGNVKGGPKVAPPKRLPWHVLPAGPRSTGRAGRMP